MKVKIFEESNPNWLYMQLNMFKKNLIDVKGIEDELISNIRPNGIITLKFDNNEDYFELFDLTSDDLYIASEAFAMYSSYEWFSYYQAKEEWNYGYLFRQFNEENLEKFNEIIEIIAPGMNHHNESDIEVIVDTMDNLFPKMVESVVMEFSNLMDSSMKKTMEDEIKNDICDVFMPYGIYSAGHCFWKYHTTVDALIKLYDEFGEKSKPLKNLLSKVGHSISIDGQYWDSYSQLPYEVSPDDDSFNRTVSRELENMMDKLEEDFTDIDEYQKIRKEILKKFRFGEWYELPKKDGIYFKLIRINPEDNKIQVNVSLGSHNRKFDYIKKLSLEDFYLFLYHPEIEFGD